jgi:hypothetical protein
MIKAFFNKDDNAEGTWVTINGRHVLIKPGETVETAFNRTFKKTGEKFDPYEEHEIHGGKLSPEELEQARQKTIERNQVYQEREKAKQARTEEARKRSKEPVNIKGKTPENYMKINNITKSIPDEYTTGLDVQVLNDDEFEAQRGEFLSPNKYGKVVATYYNGEEGTGRIIVRDSQMDNSEVVVRHEIGHHIFETKIDGATRNSWEAFWGDNNIEMPNDYARVNSNEGFAESYALWTQKDGYTKVNPGVNKWFSKNVKMK